MGLKSEVLSSYSDLITQICDLTQSLYLFTPCFLMLSGTPTLSGCCNSSTYVNPSHTIALSFGGPLEANIGWAQVLKSDKYGSNPKSNIY